MAPNLWRAVVAAVAACALAGCGRERSPGRVAAPRGYPPAARADYQPAPARPLPVRCGRCGGSGFAWEQEYGYNVYTRQFEFRRVHRRCPQCNGR